MGLWSSVHVVIVDGYTDEPAALGVPPYLGPLPRYIAGAALDAGVEEVTYLTIDQLRRRGVKGTKPRPKDPVCLPEGPWDLLVLVGGAVVPGRYLRGRPASGRELAEIARSFEGPTVLTGAVARYGWTSGSPTSKAMVEAFDHVAELDGDALLHDLIAGGDPSIHRYRDGEEWARWPVLGAPMASQHPDHPRPLIVELETYRGCIRHSFGGCSFCTTVRDAPPSFRPPSDVREESRALAAEGVVAFRIGGQSCIYSYLAEGVGETEVPTPNVEAISDLFGGVRTAVSDIEVLHVDNANPAVIAEHPKESEEVTQLLVEKCTGGNVVALGLESADPRVREANRLNASAAQCLSAIRLINRVGGETSENGLPALLPGINFLSGLTGETPDTFTRNMDFLEKVLEEGLLLRRINIRQFDVGRNRSPFRRFREDVRRRVDRAMLRMLLPFASPLRRVWTEVHDGGTTFGRQIGSYPLTVGIPTRLELGRFWNVRVVDHGFRSVTAVPDPLDINSCPMSLLAAVPGIGRKRAARIVRSRPFGSIGDLMGALDESKVAKDLLQLTDL
jgi:radical SAM superfamily enzyme with C-terminal helix-hairpin-helix motif